MKRWILGLFAVVMMFATTPAHAITVEDVIGLTRAEASDAIIISKIEADETIFRLTVDEILMLKEAGVSDVVITYMINTGKQAPLEGDDEAYVEEEMDGEGEPADAGNEEEVYYSDLDSQYRGNVSVSFGYYYPHWPGYAYSYYYDPFYWPSLSYYWAYWHPYPYYLYYYDPWYYCPSYHYAYYRSYRHGHRSHHHTYYTGRYADRGRVDGRHVGSRGPGSGERVYKDPSPEQTARLKDMRRSLKPGDPRLDTARLNDRDRRVSKRREIGGTKRIGSTRKTVRAAPTPRRQREIRNDRRREPVVRSTPRTRVKRSEPSRSTRRSEPTREKVRSRKEDSGSSKKVDKPSSSSRSSKPSYSPPPSRSSNKSRSSSKPSSSRSKSRTRKP